MFKHKPESRDTKKANHLESRSLAEHRLLLEMSAFHSVSYQLLFLLTFYECHTRQQKNAIAPACNFALADRCLIYYY